MVNTTKMGIHLDLISVLQIRLNCLINLTELYKTTFIFNSNRKNQIGYQLIYFIWNDKFPGCDTNT